MQLSLLFGALACFVVVATAHARSYNEVPEMLMCHSAEREGLDTSLFVYQYSRGAEPEVVKRQELGTTLVSDVFESATGLIGPFTSQI